MDWFDLNEIIVINPVQSKQILLSVFSLLFKEMRLSESEPLKETVVEEVVGIRTIKCTKGLG